MKRRWNILFLTLLIAVVVGTCIVSAPAVQAAGDDNAQAKSAVTTQSGAALQQSSQPPLAAERKTPWYKSRTAKIVGGSAGAGALVGGLVGGGKGAAAGALVGGGAGYVYDRKTRKK